jgi:beta-lactamase superfamily II metal-dependent hydrolase
MAWTLDIHQIDVGQGESSFLVARNPTTARTRSMLIDAGHPVYAGTVDAYIARTGVPVDHIVTSHYDDDHSGGVKALLIADNLYAVCSAIAATVAAQQTSGTRAKRIAGFAAGACSAILGAYGPAQPASFPSALVARMGVPAGATDTQAAEFGIEQAEALPPAGGQPVLPYATTTRRQVASIVAITGAQALANGYDLRDSARAAAFNKLQLGVPVGSRFSTAGRYAGVHVIDIGANPHMPAAYAAAITGTYTDHGNRAIQAPGTNRTRTAGPALGAEVLFNSGTAPEPPPNGAPAAVVTAINRTTWPTGAQFPPSGQPDNDDSIGLAVQFNNFLYWTAGDLPSQGENLVGNALMAMPLPNPAGGTYPQATCIACIKCGHHGADTATSPSFLQRVRPVGAMLSSGNNPALEHPTQEVVTRLHLSASILFFYMTNCNFATTYVPASNGGNQLTTDGNKSRIAGDNELPNLKIGRHRGDIRLTVTQASSSRPAGNAARRYAVTYWDEDAAPAAMRNELSRF